MDLHKVPGGVPSHVSQGLKPLHSFVLPVRGVEAEKAPLQGQFARMVCISSGYSVLGLLGSSDS